MSVDRQFRAGQLLLSALGIAPGEHVLDVGSGTGLLAEHAAGLVGAAGSVLGIDPLPLRVQLANQRPRDDLCFAVGDASFLCAHSDASFDVVYLNAVFHWLPDEHKPLAEFLRVLKPGGRLGLSTGEKGKNTLRASRRQVLGREPFRHYTPADDDVGHNVSRDELAALLTDPGFALQQLDVVPHQTHHASARAAVDFVQASSFGNFLGRVPDPLRPSARLEIEAELEKLRTPDGIPQQGTRLIAIALKPR